MKRVFVGMSGGVDSSVAALRLLSRGYEVVGVFIKVWQPSFIQCNWEQERLDAMRVAAHLGIPFLTMDAEEAYKTQVAEYMINSYARGLTPNPDVMCNEHVKFGVFYDWARDEGADFIATGHYAQVRVEDGVPKLKTAVDTSKDQTYFLAHMRNEVLAHVLFPVGDTLKADVRKEAARAKLPTSTKRDSQGICFLGKVDMKDFLSHYIEVKPGLVHDTSGKVIGEHKGALFYTLGERHGFTVTKGGGETTPHYVVARDLEQNVIMVDTKPKPQEAGSTITLSDVSSLGSGVGGARDAVFRYHGQRVPVTVTMTDETNAILTNVEQYENTPARGQLAVLYRGDECCGGGFIS